MLQNLVFKRHRFEHGKLFRETVPRSDIRMVLDLSSASKLGEDCMGVQGENMDASTAVQLLTGHLLVCMLKNTEHLH